MDRLSQFVVFGRPVDGAIAAFSTLTQNLVILSEDEASALRGGRVIDVEDLRRIGFLVPQDEDEAATAEALRKMLVARRDGGLSVTVVPSLGCNFSCNYCYNGLHPVEGGDTAKSFRAAFAHAEANLAEGTSLSVTWYGGEPLLFQKKLPEWGGAFVELAKQRGCRFRSDILTNGSAITPATTELLLAAGITRAQVSIDWPAGATNRKSKFATAEASLARVLKNINFLSSDIKVTLRINTAPGFLATFPELIEQIKRMVTRKVGLYCHRLYESNEASLNNQSAAQLRYDNAASYAEDFMRAKAIIRAFGYPYEYVPEQVPIGQCIAQSDDDIIFNDEGAMRKCPREIHGEGAEVYGDGTKNTQAHFYQNAQAADDLDCSRCAYLPVCHGGCVKEFYHAPTNKLNRCTLWKFTLEDELTHFLEDLPNERTHCDAQSQSHD